MDDERLRALERLAAQNEWRLKALDEWRRQIEGRLARLEDGVQELVNTNKLADALAERVKKERKFGLTVVQKLAVAVFLVASPVVSALIQRLLG